METVESYALIYWPIGILKENSIIPAGIYLRQANRGRGDGLLVPKDIYRDDRGGTQQTDSHSIVDMGSVEVTDPLVASNFQGEVLGEFDTQSSRPWVWGHQVAVAFLRGDDKVVYRHIAEMLGYTLMNGVASDGCIRSKIESLVRQVGIF